MLSDCSNTTFVYVDGVPVPFTNTSSVKDELDKFFSELEVTNYLQVSQQPSLMAITEAAHAAHEVNRAYCLGLGEWQPTWEETPQEIKESTIKGVQEVISNPSITPEELHKAWLEEKLRLGWAYGPTKNLEKKQHPCIVSYLELPEEQRIKDQLFGSTVRRVLKLC